MPQVSWHEALQAEQSNLAGQNISLTPSISMGIAWSPQARIFHPLISSSAVWSSQISLHFLTPYEQQYSIDSRMALNSSLSPDLEVTLALAMGVQDEFAGQAVRFFRNDVGYGQFSIAKYEQASIMQSIRSYMSRQFFRGLQRLKYPEIMGVGAEGDCEYWISLLSPSRITLGQFTECISKFFVTIWQKIPRSRPSLLRQQQMGAEAACAASTINGYFILIQVAIMPPNEPPNTITGQFLQQVFLMNLRNSTQSIMASSVVRQEVF